jgi:asparagine synthase (glutamine-hydrolysing)
VVPAPTISIADAKDRLLDELKVAVGLRQVSDVPVGVFLSGGVDSSTNVALFREQVSGPVKTFSIGYDAEYDSYRNELHHAAAVASRFGTEHHERRLTMDDLMAFVPRMVELQDEPIADPVCVPLYYLAEMARREGVIVAQAGEGADELFFGYENWRKKWQLQRSLSGWAGGVAGRGLLAGLTVAGRAGGKEAEAVRRTLDGRPLFWGTTEAFTDLEKRALLHPRLRGEFRDRSSWEAIAPVWERFTAKAWERSWMNWMTYVDLSTRLPELLLMRLDKMTMGASVEGREPFLDHRLAEFVLSIPEAVKLEGGVLKALLKASVRGVIPDAVIDRRKQGFGVPVTEWILGRLGTHIRETLDDFCRRTDVLDRTAVLAMYDRDRDPRLWYLYNVATWYNQFIDARS